LNGIGGWFGCFSYDSAQYSMKRHSYLTTLLDDMGIPDLHLGLYNDVLVFDHVEKVLLLSSAVIDALCLIEF